MKTETEAQKFEIQLYLPPPGWTRRSDTRSHVTAELDRLMRPPDTAMGR